MKNLYPLKLAPVIKEIVWGGTRLAKQYNKPMTGENIAESWELTVRPDGMSVIENGEYSGMTLSEYLEDDADGFPLLIKFIDAKDDLSIQVHPNDAYAREYEGEYGKTEMWYIVEANPGAHIVYGVKNYSPEGFRAALEKGTVENLMNYVPVKGGDVFFIPSGLVHAICGGVIIAEIQQSSNVTYRVYDYNRKPPRQLHIDKALDVIVDWSDAEIESKRYSQSAKTDPKGLLAACEYFAVHRYEIRGEQKLPRSTGFYHLLCLSGHGKMRADGSDEIYEVRKGDSYYIPVGIGEITLDGYFDVVVSEV